jgi:hypothetical protein
MLKIEPPTCEKLFIVPTFGLLLQIHNIMCTLHNDSSIVETWNFLTFFFKINIWQKNVHC